MTTAFHHRFFKKSGGAKGGSFTGSVAFREFKDPETWKVCGTTSFLLELFLKRARR
jgi:hypothetical protein